MGLAMRAAPVGHVLDVGVEQQVRVSSAMAEHNLSRGGPRGRYASLTMSNLDRRGSYTPRRVREQRAYRLAVAGSVAGGVVVVSLVLAIVGVVDVDLPIIALIVAAICMYGFHRTTGQR